MSLRRLSALFALFAIFATACTGGSSTGVALGGDATEDITLQGTQRAPEFPTGVDWINVDGPLTLDDLKGKVVLLDFWTLGCINCVHVIPDLKRLEAEHPDTLAVVGVHSAKFSQEANTDTIRESVVRYGVEHPVVNDFEFTLWNALGVSAWPTVALIDPNGNYVGMQPGEGVYDFFKPLVAQMESEFDAAGGIDRTPLDIKLAASASEPTVLSYPGKVLADEDSDRLFIADSNHNRILISDLDGALQDSIGSGQVGFTDGSFEEARFNRPQGLALDGDMLFVADLENHAIRAVDLVSKTVTTVAGTGQMEFNVSPGEVVATETALNSPWDVAVDRDRVFIAMSGQHQLWVLDRSTGLIRVLAGSGREALTDGPPESAGMNQPSGLVVADDRLYFTDPEASAIRYVELANGDEVVTIVGQGLFDWGDVDGTGDDVLLQHAVGIAELDGALYVADTYNHKLKLVVPADRSSRTIVGTGETGWVDGPIGTAQLAEPSGVSIAHDTVYVADTNNHLVRTLDLSTGELDTLRLSNLEIAATSSINGPGAETIVIGPLEVAPGSSEVVLDISVPSGFKFNELGPTGVEWTVDGQAVSFTAETSYGERGPTFPQTFPIAVTDGASTITGTSTIFYCRVGEEEYCLIRDVVFEVPVTVTQDGDAGPISVTYTLPKTET